MTEFIAVVSILKPRKPELQGSTWLLWVSYKIFFYGFGGLGDLFLRKLQPYSVPNLMHLHFNKK